MPMTLPSYATALEPATLAAGFLSDPPAGFHVTRLTGGLLGFIAPYDLTMSLDPAIRERMQRLPGVFFWRRLWTWSTCFIGCTTTEYTPVPDTGAPAAMVTDILRYHAGSTSLLVVKDLAVDSPLLDAPANARSEALLDALVKHGFTVVEGMPLAWVRIDFSCIDDYLARLSASRRSNIRRKLKARAGLDVALLDTGDEAFGGGTLAAQCYQLYLNVHAQSSLHFDLLTEGFITGLLRDGASGGKVFLYRDRGRLIGWNLCYVHAGMLVDKYVGFAYPQAHRRNLYVVSWIINLEYALEHRLTHYVAGHPDSQVKRQLGASFTPTRHAVFSRSPLLRFLLRRHAHRLGNQPGSGG